MSLEQAIQNLTTEIIALRNLISAKHPTDETPSQSTPAVPQAAPVPPVQAYTPPPVQAVPEVPAFAQAPAAAAPVSAATNLPFNDSASLTKYCMAKYAALGPTKGASIQTILMECGASHIGALDPSKYAEFFAKVEAL